MIPLCTCGTEESVSDSSKNNENRPKWCKTEHIRTCLLRYCFVNWVKTCWSSLCVTVSRETLLGLTTIIAICIAGQMGNVLCKLSLTCLCTFLLTTKICRIDHLIKTCRDVDWKEHDWREDVGTVPIHGFYFQTFWFTIGCLFTSLRSPMVRVMVIQTLEDVHLERWNR